MNFAEKEISKKADRRFCIFCITKKILPNEESTCKCKHTSPAAMHSYLILFQTREACPFPDKPIGCISIAAAAGYTAQNVYQVLLCL